MPIFTIRHVTTYCYRQPVTFGQHRMMLRPRDDHDQKVLHSEIDISPRPSQLAWTRDHYGNHVATANFAQRAAELRFESRIRLEHASAGLPEHIEAAARGYPFVYPDDERRGLGRSIAPPAPTPAIDRWARQFLRADGSADTPTLLTDMTQTIKRTFKHAARHEPGIQEPLRTLTLASGSCRDHAVLMIAALRSLGIAARFVSGYLHLPDDDDDPGTDTISGGNTHAWVQARVPGAGWIDFDPSSGTIGNRNLVRVAVVHAPGEAIPLQGTWIGASSDHLAMKVAVRVTAAPNPAESRRNHVDGTPCQSM